jgi:hypothetical protein
LGAEDADAKFDSAAFVDVIALLTSLWEKEKLNTQHTSFI